MTLKFQLVHDTLLANNVPADADFLQWNVAVVHVDGYTHGKKWDDDEKCELPISKNHWVFILETADREQVRLSLDGAQNAETKVPGVLELSRLSYRGPSISVVHRETYSWRGAPTTIQQLLEHALTRGWHRYQMVVGEAGGVKGCRHHLQVVLADFVENGWVEGLSDAGNDVDDYIAINYTRIGDDIFHDDADPIDYGTFL